MDKKKQRGQNRKLKSLLKNIKDIKPFEDTTVKYEHFHVPCGRFISSLQTNGKIKTAFCRAWLEKTAEIAKKKPTDLHFCKVVAMIDATDFWNSQIIIFYDKSYYDSFWIRNSSEQTWLSGKNDKLSFAQGRNIETQLKEQGYVEIISEPDFYKRSELWFYGDI